MKNNARSHFFFDKPFRLSPTEKALFLNRADEATASLKRNQKRDCLLGGVSSFSLLGGLATYAFLLRHLAAGHRARYFAPFHPAGCMAAFLGHADILRILEAHGIPLESLEWSWHKANVLDFAVMGRHYAFVKELLVAHPTLVKKKWRQDAVAYCVQHGTIPILRLLQKHGASLVRSYWRRAPGAQNRSPEGTPFFLAVAMGRKDMVRELIRLEAFPDWKHMGGTSAAHLSASLLSLAIENDDFELADWLIEHGCTHEEMCDLPDDSFALDHLRRFRYLCRKFPEEDYKELVRQTEDFTWSDISWPVLSFAWDGNVPENVRKNWKQGQKDACQSRPGDPFPEDFLHLSIHLDTWPDELLRLEQEQPGRFRRMLLERTPQEWGNFHSIVYLMRLAAANGIVLFRNKKDKTAFLKRIHDYELTLLRPHLAEFGLPPVSDAAVARLFQKEGGHPKRDARETRLRKLAATPLDNLRAVLDNPSLDPDAEINANWSLALEIASCATPRVFDAWILRGMDPYDSNCEGVTAMEVAPAGLISHLVKAYGMSPDHVSWDGTTPMGHAIRTNDLPLLRSLLAEGASVNGTKPRGQTPLRAALVLGRDEIAQQLIAAGAVNRDRTGRILPLPPWMGPGFRVTAPGR
ncbi:MAG: hypothetical protein IJT88_05305 [Kiritimatiellae bacterium]|nr:hypothetical protein [Kiritimatiellia bacterium]